MVLLMLDAAWDPPGLVMAILSNIDGLDMLTLDPAYLVALADAFMMQPLTGNAGAHGGAATEYSRSAWVRDFCFPHKDDATLYCLRDFLHAHAYSPGMFLSATRDRAGAAFRLLMQQSSERAIAKGVVFSNPADGLPMPCGRREGRRS